MTQNCLQSCVFHHTPRHPYSSDISPCDFFLFGDLQTKLKDKDFKTMEALQRRVEDEIYQVSPETTRRVSEHWTERLNQLIQDMLATVAALDICPLPLAVGFIRNPKLSCEHSEREK
jgi:hypothetical protein